MGVQFEQHDDHHAETLPTHYALQTTFGQACLARVRRASLIAGPAQSRPLLCRDSPFSGYPTSCIIYTRSRVYYPCPTSTYSYKRAHSFTSLCGEL